MELQYEWTSSQASVTIGGICFSRKWYTAHIYM